jgi:hypothetical protein
VSLARTTVKGLAIHRRILGTIYVGAAAFRYTPALAPGANDRHSRWRFVAGSISYAPTEVTQ